MDAHILNRGSFRIRAALTALTAGAALAVGTASPAQAVTTPGSGTPGQVTFASFVNAKHYYPTTPRLILGATTVYRSAYAGTQTVTVTYAILSNAGGKWGVSRSSTRWVQLAPGYHGNFSPLEFAGLYGASGYKAAIVVEWKDPFGNLLGQRIINYNGNSDYQCLTNDPVWAPCKIYNNSDGFGAFVGFG